MRIPLLALLAAAVAILWWLLWPALTATAGLVFVATVAAFTIRYLSSAWRVLTAGRADGPSPALTHAREHGEPAFPRYLVSQVWRDHFSVLADTLSTASRPALLLSAGATKILVGGWQAVALAPVWAAAVVGLLAAAACCAAVVLVVFSGHAATAGLAAGAQLAGIGLARGLDGLWAPVSRTRPACPHAGCYRSFTRAEHACPRCGVTHRNLAPGRHGVIWRTCRCGASLPASVLFGRNRLTAACPHCHRPLVDRVGQAPLVHLPVVGGPAAGKSTYALLAVAALDRDGERVRFADQREGEVFAARLSRLRAGEAVPRTPVELPQATVVDLELVGAGRCLMYLFDPPGEHYTTADRIAWQRYLDVTAGLLLVVDPLSLDVVRRSLTPAEKQRLRTVGSSAEDPTHMIDRLVGALRTRPDSGTLTRVAVVVTKLDALRQTAVGQPLAGVGAAGPSPEPAADEVRDWLNGVGWGNPMRTLDRAAGQVRYFGSGLDLPSCRLAEPVRWLAEGSLRGRSWALPTPSGASRSTPAKTAPSERRAGATDAQREPAASSLGAQPERGADRIPPHYRLIRRALLVQMWLLTVTSVAATVSAVAVTGWHALLK